MFEFGASHNCDCGMNQAVRIGRIYVPEAPTTAFALALIDESRHALTQGGFDPTKQLFAQDEVA
jgi:hypothetical protein